MDPAPTGMLSSEMPLSGASRPAPRGDAARRPRKIVHLSTVHVAGDTRIAHKECRSLMDAGYEVTLIVASDGEVPVPGLRVVRLPTPRGRLHRSTVIAWRALTTALRQRADLIHFHDPELIPVALLLKALGQRVVYDVHEHLPRQIMTKQWIPRVLRAPIAHLAGAVESAADRFLDGIAVANPSTMPRFRPEHTVLVQNFARIRSDDVAPPLAERRMRVVYVGGLSHHRGLPQMLGALHALDRPEVNLVLVGPLESTMDDATLDGIRDQVDVRGRLHRQEVDAILHDARIGLSTLQPIPNYVSNYPTKLFEYMAARMPVIASDFPLYRAVVEEARCGLVVDPTSPDAIADAIAHLLDNPDEAQAMADRGRAAALEHYSWDVAQHALLDLYARILGD